MSPTPPQPTNNAPTRTIVSFQVWEKIIGVPVYYYDLPSQNAFTTLTNDDLLLLESDSISIISVLAISTSLQGTLNLRRQLTVNLSVASEFYFTVSAAMESYNYADPIEFALVLQDRLYTAYTNPAIAGEYVSMCVDNEAQYFTSTTEVLFTAPRFSDIQVGVINTYSPTSVPAQDSSRNANPLMGSIPYMYLYIVAGGILLLIVICSVLIVRNCYKAKRKLPVRDPQINLKEKNQDFDFDEVDFYSPSTEKSPTSPTPKSSVNNFPSENSKSRRSRAGLQSSPVQSDEVTIEMKNLETPPSQSQEAEETLPDEDRPKPRPTRITIISGSGSVVGAKKKLSSASPIDPTN
jgi:hypothetical protein